MTNRDLLDDFVDLPCVGLRLTPAEFAIGQARWRAANAISSPTQPPLAALVDAKTMAERLGVPESQVEQLARAGSIPSILIGRYRRYDPCAVLKALPTEG